MKTNFLNCNKNFNCIADKCTDTCCAGWIISIDEQTAKKYLTNQSNFSTELKHNLDLTKNGYVTKQKCERCAFLDENNLCKIYKNLGENALSEVCTNHPRFINDFGGLKEVCFSLSCPEAVRLLFEEKNVEVVSEDSNFAVTPNDIDHDFYFELKKEREQIFSIIKSDVDFREKLLKIYEFTGERNKFKYKKFLKKLAKCDFTRTKLKDAVKSLYNDKNYTFPHIESENYNALNNLLFAYVFRFYLTAVFGESKATIIKFILASVYTILLLSQNNSLEEITRLYSRDIIHSEENLIKLKKLLSKV